MQEVKAVLRHARISPQKARLVVGQIRGLKVDKALELLTFSPKKAAKMIKKLLASSVANAENNAGLDIDDLRVYRAYVDQAPSMKRIKARAKGRSNRIIKRNSHITIVVASPEAMKKERA